MEKVLKVQDRDKSRQDFLTLLRSGIGCKTAYSLANVDWEKVKVLALQQVLFSVVADGLGRMPLEARPPEMELFQWIAMVSQDENRFDIQHGSAMKMAELLHENGIRTYVLKGEVVSECYPNPKHRYSADCDCFLLSEDGKEDAWNRGNVIVKEAGFEVSVGFYKNSTFHLPGLMVENHVFLTPFRGNKVLNRLEKLLQKLLREDLDSSDIESRRFEGTWLYRPPMMVSALFLIEHAYSHFLHEGLTWRHVLDWAMFKRKHQNDINWNELNARIGEFGFRKFYDTYERLSQYLLGEITEIDLSERDKMMLADVWEDLDLHETVQGAKGKLALVGNTIRARWKYRHFAEISMIHALWIQVKGVLLNRHPKLD